MLPRLTRRSSSRYDTASVPLAVAGAVTGSRPSERVLHDVQGGSGFRGLGRAQGGHRVYGGLMCRVS